MEVVFCHLALVEQLVCERGQLADRTDGDRDTLLAEIRELYEKNDSNNS